MSADNAYVHPLEGGKLARNIMHFARALRAAGLPVGPGKMLEAVRAAELVGVMQRADFYWALHSALVERREQHELFDQAFQLFWRNPRVLDRIVSDLLAANRRLEMPETPKASRRVSEALAPEHAQEPKEEEKIELEVDATLSYSPQEVLQDMDFDTMSTEELTLAKRAIAGMRLPIMAVPTRRFMLDPRGHRIDMRATLRASLRSAGDLTLLKRKRRRERHPPLVILCDISGSMSRYSRMFLHFVHAVTNDRDRVFTFIFGTRLTNITRHLHHRDVDVALDRVAKSAEDWSGGTRIGPCLKDFNQHWARRVLGQGAVVLLITDGLDRDDVSILGGEIERLSMSCRHLIWLNPLLRYEGFRPEAGGVKTILPFVNDMRSVHNLNSLQDIAEALSKPVERGWEGLSAA